MTKTLRDNEVTERLRSWIEDHYSARGKFKQLEQDSRIPAQRWKNLYYGQQFATPEMLEFVETMATSDGLWVRTGMRPLTPENYPFLTSPPTEEEQATLKSRLIWTIKEWASPRGAQLFQYLSEKRPSATEDEWASMILGKAQPTAGMIEVVCGQRPYLTTWIIIGIDFGREQVDPSKEESIKRWIEAKEAQASALFAGLAKVPARKQPPPPKTAISEAESEELVKAPPADRKRKLRSPK